MSEQMPQATTSDLMAELRRVAAGVIHSVPEHIILTREERLELTGDKMATRQLVELHRAGFHRARIGPVGQLILERAHYQAVCAVQVPREKPKMQPFKPSH